MDTPDRRTSAMIPTENYSAVCLNGKISRRSHGLPVTVIVVGLRVALALLATKRLGLQQHSVRWR